MTNRVGFDWYASFFTAELKYLMQKEEIFIDVVADILIIIRFILINFKKS